MNKLKQLQAIQAKLMKKHACSKGQANVRIALLCECEVNTIETWLSESQRQPIPDPHLRLLTLLIYGH